MTEQHVLDTYYASPRNRQAKIDAVHSLRHLTMDKITFNVKDDEQYWFVYSQVMESIAERYPFLSQEVKRQMAKKKRRQSRRSLVKCEEIMHI